MHALNFAIAFGLEIKFIGGNNRACETIIVTSAKPSLHFQWEKIVGWLASEAICSLLVEKFHMHVMLASYSYHYEFATSPTETFILDTLSCSRQKKNKEGRSRVHKIIRSGRFAAETNRKWLTCRIRVAHM